jgi:putative ABC transport system permease protein
VSLWRQLARGVRALTDRPAADQDVADEVEHYLEQATAAQVARGLPRDEALRAARLELGGVINVREDVRGYGWENAVEAFVADLRYAGRRLRHAPGFTAVAVLTLALGIGGTTAIFSAVNPILFEPLPYPDAGRLAQLLEINTDGSRGGGTFGMYHGLVARARTFDAIAVLRPWQPALTGPAEPEVVEGQRVSAGYFRVLGVPPMLGRDFLPAEDQANGPNVVILGAALWRRRFAADRGIAGRAVTLDGAPYVVIGVMPEGFENVLAPAAQLWAPLQYDMAQGRAWGHHLRTIGRLRPGIALDVASREINELGQAVLKEQHPETYGRDVVFRAASLQGEITRGVRPALFAILGAVLLVLVIACVNVTNLLLARGAQRRGEFALRAALGAGQGRLLRQLLTESLLLAAIGGVAGMGVALVGVRALVGLTPVGLPRASAIGVHPAVFVFGLALTTLIGLAFGSVPAVRASRSDPQEELHHASRRAAGGHQRTRAALVVAEVALALVLLVGSGLLFRSLQRLFAVDAGFDAAHLITMQVQMSGSRFADSGAAIRFLDQALVAVRRVPGVTAAAFTSQLPLSGDRDEYGLRFEAFPGEGDNGYRYAVSPGYIEAMRIPLRRGRTFGERDRANTPFVALISEALARRRFPGTDPIGQRLGVGPTSGYTVVGVVGDVRQASLALSEPDAVYIPASQWPAGDRTMSLVARAGGPAATLAGPVREAIWSADKDQPVVRIATMDDLLAASTAERRFSLVLFEVFGLAALVLAAAGIYGVLAGGVAERVREIGVRSALGATRADILALVLRQGLALTALGVGIGLAAAAASSRAIAAMLFGVSPLDPATYLSVIALLVAVALIAASVPAWRAARVDPATTLRLE